MPVTLTVAYPSTSDETFDHAYYASSHMAILFEVMTPLGMTGASASRGLTGGPGQPSPFHAVATLEFPDMPTLESALGGADRVLADIPNYYSGQPTMMIGEVIG